jgi:phosphoesterase RecJ-like protein
MKKEVLCYCADSVPNIYQFLPGAEQVVRRLPHRIFDLCFVLDSSGLDRIGEGINLADTVKFVVNIDHHPDNSKFGDINYLTKAASVGEQIIELAKSLKRPLDLEAADPLYVSIITDTGNFRYENTTAKTFRLAAELLKAGVNPHQLTTKIYDNQPVAALKIAGLALGTLALSAGGKLATAAVTEQMMSSAGATGQELVGIVDRLCSIEKVEVAILFREDQGKVKMNFRSKNNFNVSELAAEFGGGGHHKAAGAVLSGELAAVVAKVTARAVERLWTA